MQENDTNSIAVTDKVEALTGKLDLRVRKLGRKSLDIFSPLKGFVAESIVEASVTIKNHWVNLQSRFSKYFPEAVYDKYKRIPDSFHANSNYEFYLSLENYIDVSDTSLKFRFPRKAHIEFWVCIGGEFPHLSRKALNILLPFATSCLCETGFSAMAAIRTTYRSVMNLENDLRAAISELQPC
jgi:hypothetical protein